MTTPQQLADQVAAFSDQCRQTTSNVFETELHLDRESLLRVDELIELNWCGEPPTMLDQMTLLWGAYVGECIRALHGGRWEVRGDEGVALTGVGGKGLTVFPYARMQKRFVQGMDASISAYLAAIEELLASDGDGDADGGEIRLPEEAAPVAREGGEEGKTAADELLDALRGLAAQFLREGEPFPVSGATQGADGKGSLAKAWDGEGYEAPEKQVALLEAAFRQQAEAGEIVACAVAVAVETVDPRSGESIEALLVALETPAGALDLVTPYSGTGEDFAYGRPFGSQRPGRVWTAGSGRTH